MRRSSRLVLDATGGGALFALSAWSAALGGVGVSLVCLMMSAVSVGRALAAARSLDG